MFVLLPIVALLIYCFVYSGQETFAYFGIKSSNEITPKPSTNKIISIILVCALTVMYSFGTHLFLIRFLLNLLLRN